MNYFDFFELSPAFVLDESALRRSYLLNSKKYHPDFHSLATEEEQAEMLELSTLNNQAYNCLKDFDERMKYILSLHHLMDEQENRKALAQDFLMEMMEVNEALMELEFDFNPKQFLGLKSSIKSIQEQELHKIQDDIKQYDYPSATESSLQPILAYFLKSRYLKRLANNLQKIEEKAQKI